MIYCNQVLGSAYKTNIEPLFILQKRAGRIILGVHPRSPSEPLFTTLQFLNCDNIFKYLIGRLMYRIYHGEVRVLHCLFTKNSDKHVYYTRQQCSYHMPVCRTKLGKCGLRYSGASVWNNIRSVNLNRKVSEFIFSRSLRAAICNNLLLSKLCTTWHCVVDVQPLVMPFSVNFSVAPSAPLLEYTCYMWNRQGAHKSHRITSSPCPHDYLPLHLYWYL